MERDPELTPLPPRGWLVPGVLVCSCACHSVPGVYHVIACCSGVVDKSEPVE